MKNVKKIYSLGITAFVLLMGTITYAATSPSLGVANSFAILASTYTNTTAGTTINGDIGYTTPPAWMPIFNGSIYIANITYNQAGIDQGIALTSLNTQGCTYTFPAGDIDLSIDNSRPSSTIGIYEPGVYCTLGAASIGTAGITLSGNGTYIFKINGAFTTVDNSIVRLSGGTSECDVWWTSIAASTLGANTTFKGNIVAAGSTAITVGANTIRGGKALAFGSTITTNNNTITAGLCGVVSPKLTLKKIVINDNGGTKVISDFPLFVSTYEVKSGSGTILSPGTYTVSETTTGGYAASIWEGDCSSTGLITLVNGDNKTCTVTNNDIATNGGGGGGGGVTLTMDVCLTGDYSPSYYDNICGIAPIATGEVTPIATGEVTPIITPVILETGDTPKLPNTGINPETTNIPLRLLVTGSILAALSVMYLTVNRKATK